jgi:hypothetical protein
MFNVLKTEYKLLLTKPDGNLVAAIIFEAVKDNTV